MTVLRRTHFPLMICGVIAFTALTPRSASALSITLYDGRSPQIGVPGTLFNWFPGQVLNPTSAQLTDLIAIMDAAASYWEARILDPSTVFIGVGYANLGAGILASTVPLSFSPDLSHGAGFIALDSPCPAPPAGCGAGQTDWNVDPTPLDNSEFSGETRTFSDLGGGELNTGHYFSGGSIAGVDMLTVAIHELGHALAGASFGLGTFDLEITEPLPYAGSLLPYVNAHLGLPTALMNPFLNFDRELISDADLLFVAQQRGFQQVDVDFDPVPEPATMMLLGSGLAGVIFRLRRRAD